VGFFMLPVLDANVLKWKQLIQLEMEAEEPTSPALTPGPTRKYQNSDDGNSSLEINRPDPIAEDDFESGSFFDRPENAHPVRVNSISWVKPFGDNSQRSLESEDLSWKLVQLAESFNGSGTPKSSVQGSEVSVGKATKRVNFNFECGEASDDQVVVSVRRSCEFSQPSLTRNSSTSEHGPSSKHVKAQQMKKRKMARMASLQRSSLVPLNEEEQKIFFQLVNSEDVDRREGSYLKEIVEGGQITANWEKKEVGEDFHADRRFGKTWTQFQNRDYVKKIEKFVDGTKVQLFLLVLTLFALFGEDIKMSFLPREVDHGFRITTILVFCSFLLELVVISVVKPKYFLNFFFWLDLIAAISLLSDFLSSSVFSTFAMARAGRAARLGTRAARLVRFLRLMRMWRILKNRKNILSDKEDEGFEKPSHVWQEMADLTTRKLVIGVLIMLVIVPLLDVPLSDYSPYLTCDMLEQVEHNSNTYGTLMNLYTSFNKRKMDFPVVWIGQCATGFAQDSSPYPWAACNSSSFALDYPEEVGVDCLHPSLKMPQACDQKVDLLCNDKNYDYTWRNCTSFATQDGANKKYRVLELLTDKSDTGNTEIWVEITNLTRLSALFQIILTLFVIVFLVLWSFSFTKDANRLMVRPIEKMVAFIQMLAANPLSAVMSRDACNTGMETDKIMIALQKITGLLRVAMGEAGLGIILSNLNSEDDDFNPMIPGKKIQACFGFCDIRRFTDTTECLQEEVMVFVNNIADIVHEAAVRTNGAPNKNIGDAFLCVWKNADKADNGIVSYRLSRVPMAEGSNPLYSDSHLSMADNALCSWLLVMEQMSDSPSVLQYSQHPKICQALGEDYSVKLGFGFHVGWAIEGAIGSIHKVDPSYLSPHVNMAARLEAATKQYGVGMLMSDAFFAAMRSKTAKAYIRKLDRVTLKGSTDRVTLYTYDLHYKNGLTGIYSEYKNMFELSVKNYLQGDWSSSRTGLTWCKEMWPTDMPVDVLLRVMEEHAFRAPSDWQGYRELTEK